MTQIHWTNPVSGEFSTAADWTGGVVPGASDDAILDAAGAPYTVTASTNETVRSIQTAANATLFIDGGIFTATKATGAGANAGDISVEDAELKAGGTLMNTGLITLIGGDDVSGNPKSTLVVAKALTLEGGGTIEMIRNRGFGGIKGAADNAVLTNVDNTISGAGQIGLNFTLQLINEAGGVIDADVPATGGLLIYDDRPSVNAGLMEATSGGSLTIATTTIDNAGGTIQAAGGGQVSISDSATLTGGEIIAGSGSVVDLSSQVTVTDSVLSIAAGGTIDIVNGTAVTANGVIANAGTIQLGQGADDSPKLIFDATASLTGGGMVLVSLGATIQGSTGSDVLTNVDNTIVGSGHLGNGSLTLVNEAGGVIESNGNGGAVPFTLDTGPSTISNAGLIEGVGTVANLVIDSPVLNSGTLAADGGTFTVNAGVTGTVGSAVIASGTLNFNAGFNEKVSFVGGSGVLKLAKSTKFHKQITGFSATGGTTLDLGDVGFVSSDEATYSGTKSAGVLTVSDGAHTALIDLKGNYLGATFTASSDGHDGVDIVATTPPGAAAGRFIAAAAALGGQAGGSMSVAEEAALRSPTMLARPEVREA